MPKLWSSGLALLPDEQGNVPLENGVGLVHAAQDAGFAARTAQAMRGPDGSGPDVLAVCRREGKLPEETAAWRGMTAAALLLDTWREESGVRTLRVARTMTGLAADVLTAAGRDELHLAILLRGERRAILGVVDRGRIIVPAAAPERLDGLLPQRVNWYREGAFTDPCAVLNQRDRRTLERRLRLFPDCAAAIAFADDLRAADLAAQPDADWLTRMQAVIALAKEEHYARMLTVRQEAYAPGRGENPVLEALGVREPLAGRMADALVYEWNGVPFGRSNVRTGVESAGNEGEAQALEEIRAEMAQLETYSTRYLRECGERVEKALPGFDAEFLPEARQQLGLWQDQVRERSRQPVQMLEVTWPWAAESPALQTLMEEALGGQLAGAALDVFPEKLGLMQGGTMNDALLDQVCSVTIGGVRWTSLLPVSGTMAEYIARFGWAGRGLVPDCIRLTAAEDGAVTVTILLADRGNVRMTRTYPAEEQVRWSDLTVPEVSLWPSVPVERGRWKAYFVSVRGKAEISLLRGGQWVDGRASDVFVRATVTQTDEFPACVALRQEGATVGAVWYLADVFHPEGKGRAVGALDLGSSGISMAVNVGGETLPVQMPSLWRVMLGGSRRDLAGETLPVWPLGPVLPAAVVMDARSVDPAPFADGYIVHSDALQDERVRAGVEYDLLWRSDEAGCRARRLALREAMLLTAFHAVMNGADSIAWRLALPRGMTEGGWMQMLDEMRELAGIIRSDTGLDLTGNPPEGMPGDLAAGTWLRDSGTMRGSFAMLDVGASSTTGAVWLRGVERPVMHFDLTGGLRTLAMGGLMDRPDKLVQDFEGLAALDVTPLANSLDRAGRSMDDWLAAELLLDRLLGEQLPMTMPWMNMRCANLRMTYTQALLVLGLAQLMTMTGMMLEKVYRSPLLNDRLPQEMQLCLCGRGSEVLLAMDETLRYQLMRFVRLPMTREHPVRALGLAVSGMPRMEAVLGLAGIPALPRTAEEPEDPILGGPVMLSKYFLLNFRTCFPQAADLLFPGMFGPGGMFSPAAENVVDAAAAHQRGSEEQAFMNVIAAVRAGFAGIVE